MAPSGRPPAAVSGSNVTPSAHHYGENRGDSIRHRVWAKIVAQAGFGQIQAQLKDEIQNWSWLKNKNNVTLSVDGDGVVTSAAKLIRRKNANAPISWCAPRRRP